MSAAITEGAGEVYFAPAGTAPPTSTSRAALEAAGWQFIANTENEVSVNQTQPMRGYNEAGAHKLLGPDGFVPNRATRRAAARDTKRAQR